MESLIQITAVGGPILLAIMGLGVSLSPPSPEGRVHWVWFGAFVIVGLVTTYANYRELSSSDAIQKEIKFVLDQLHLDVQRIEPAPGDRKISASQKESVVAILKVSPRPSKVSVACNMSDVEGCEYAHQWADVLQAAGWSTEELQSVFTSPPRGVIIQVKDPNTPGAGPLQYAITSTGIKPAGIVSQTIQDGVIQLVIGGKLK